LWEDGYPFDYNFFLGDRGIEKGIGDNTVPIESATGVIGTEFVLNSVHGNLQTDGEGIVYAELTGVSPTVLISEDRIKDYKFLILDMLSPADMQVVAPDGKRIGKNFETGEEINEIEDAFYSGFATENEFITIPDPLDGEYKVITQGTGNGGEYTVATGYISDKGLINKDFTAFTEPGMVTELNLTLNSSQEDPVVIIPEDTVAPEISIISPKNRDYLRSELLPINVELQDESGVQSSTLKFDETEVSQGREVDLFYESLGNHKFSVSAKDNVGNATSTEINLRVIATLKSTISDIERAYDLSWISSKRVKNQLIRRLRRIIRLEQRVEFFERRHRNKKIKKLEKRIKKILEKKFLKKLGRDYYKKERINQQAYELLKEDIEWLINN